jgi:hypothetical protein
MTRLKAKAAGIDQQHHRFSETRMRLDAPAAKGFP